MSKLAPQPVGPIGSSPSITMEVTPQMMATLQRISRDSKQPLDVVFTKAIGLYQATLQATAEGKHVGYSASPDALDVEFTGAHRSRGAVGVSAQKFDIGSVLAEGSKVESLTIKAPEDPEEKAARLRREFWTFVVKELLAYAVAFLFLIVIGGYCCFVVARHGVISAEVRAVFSLITTLFGGVVGLIVGKSGK